MRRICHHIQSLEENNRLQKSLVYVPASVAVTKKKKGSSREENIFLLLPLVLICAFPFERSPVSAKVPQKHARFGVCHTSWVQSPDHTALISLIPLHIEVTVVCNGKDMRIFIAERMWAYSFASFRLSQDVQLPCKKPHSQVKIIFSCFFSDHISSDIRTRILGTVSAYSLSPKVYIPN